MADDAFLRLQLDRVSRKTTRKCIFLMVALCLVGFLLWLSLIPQAPLSKDVQLLLHNKERPPATSRRSLKLWPPCHRNLSVVNITGFSELPDRLQNFLHYQHCKHFPLLLDLPKKCDVADGSDIFLLLVIKSQPENHERRQVLRETWAEERLHNGVWIRRVFISGTAGKNLEMQRFNKLMEFEHRKHGDILQWDFQESFLNLTLKQVLFLDWLQERCPRVHFLLNGDDDIFAHTDNMVEYLQSIPKRRGKIGHLFVGSLMEGNGPIRENNKYFVPVQVQESDSYPAYCSGGGYLLSSLTAKVLYEMSKYVPLHPIDDAYMGMCLARAGLKPSGHRGMNPWGIRLPSAKMDSLDPCFFKDLLMVHSFRPHQMYVLWHQVHDSELKCWSTGLSPTGPSDDNT